MTNRRITRFFRPNSDQPSSSNTPSIAATDEPSSECADLPSRLFTTGHYPDARLNTASVQTKICAVDCVWWIPHEVFFGQVWWSYWLPCGEYPEDYDPEYDLAPAYDDVYRKLRLAFLLIVDGVLLASSQTHRPTFNFPLALQLLAFRNISGLLDKYPGSADTRTFLEWYSLGLPKNNIPFTDVHCVERLSDLSVTPYFQVGPQKEGWGEWDDEVKDKRISYLVSQIENGRIFKKKLWPGGDASLPLISVPEKKDNVIHKKHIVPRRREVSAKLGVKQALSKPIRSCSTCLRQRFTNSDDSSFSDFKVVVEAEFRAITKETESKFKQLEAETNKLQETIKALRMERFNKHPSRKSL
ncbi:PREDICTED: uncharacterized protein LOC109127315 [Camelina sativa]|uniref:Uncharacterized protein LOC109127315 n=1 Tax=Camelina sativa TaxID=90675 RepID=A0ABM1QL17_CAMSA|nr:PREDICTED: uncharacterized protein LOC109127315 [Camelina sativa]